MAITNVKLKTDVANGKTSSTTKKQTKRKRVVTKRVSRKVGVETLFEVADRLVGENAATIADLFKEEAVVGNLAKTKMLVELAMRKKPRAEPVKKPRRGKSAAQELEEDLRLHGEWKAEVAKEMQEAGNRE